MRTRNNQLADQCVIELNNDRTRFLGKVSSNGKRKKAIMAFCSRELLRKAAESPRLKSENNSASVFAADSWDALFELPQRKRSG
jgi:hypothetical protein